MTHFSAKTRLSDTRYLNDPLEGSYCVQVIKRIASELLQQDIITETFYRLVHDVKLNDRELFPNGNKIELDEYKTYMRFITEECPPRDIEEQLLFNNRMAGSYAGANLYRPIDEDFMKELASILTENMDRGGPDYREGDSADSAALFVEEFFFPPAYVLSQRMRELCTFLASLQIHPLIKAGVAQIYLFAVRPFREGNERLGRLLSCMILLRAGYSFFSDVSLSALIARKSYGYYEAVANSLREENGGNLTYFLECFLGLLSRAVDERRLRMEKAQAQGLQNEQAMAQTPLMPVTHEQPFPPDDGPGSGSAHEAGADGGQSKASGFSLSGYTTIPAAETARSGTETTGQVSCPAELLECEAHDKNTLSGRVADCLLRRLNDGQRVFTSREIVAELGICPQQVSTYIRKYKGCGIIELDHKDDRSSYYRFVQNGE